MCLFAGAIPKQYMIEAIRAHEQEIESVIKDMNEHISCCEETGSRFAIGYGLAAKRAALSFIKENKEQLLNAEPLCITLAPPEDPHE